MPDRVRVRRRSTGEVGTWVRGDPSSFLPDTAPQDERSPLFQRAQQVMRVATQTPFLHAGGAGVLPLLPTKFLEPAGAVAGGVAGQASRLPFAATLGSGFGAAAGRAAAEARRGEAPSFRDLGTSAARAAGATALGAGAVRAGGGLVQAIRGLPTLFSESKLATQAGRAREALEQVQSGAGPAFEASLKQLPGTTDVSKPVTQVLDMLTDPQSGTAVQEVLDDALANAAKVGDTTLQRFLQNPQAASSATPLEAHQVAVTFQQLPTILRERLLSPAASAGMHLLRRGPFDKTFTDLSNVIRQQLSAQFPGTYSAILQQYAKTTEQLRLLKPEFLARGNRLVRNIKEGFGGGEVEQAVRETLPSSVSKPMFQTAAAQRLMDPLGLGGFLKRLIPGRR